MFAYRKPLISPFMKNSQSPQHPGGMAVGYSDQNETLAGQVAGQGCTRFILDFILSIEALIRFSIFKASSTFPRKALLRVVSTSAFKSLKALPIPPTSLKRQVTEFLRLSMMALIWKASPNSFSLFAIATSARSSFCQNDAMSTLLTLRMGEWKWFCMHSKFKQMQGCLQPCSAHFRSNF